MDHPRIATIKHEMSVQEDFRRMLCACCAKPLDTTGVRQLALQLSAKWGLGANARDDPAAGAAASAEAVDSTRLIEEIESLLAAFDEPAAPTWAAAAMLGDAADDGPGGDDPVPPLRWDVLRDRCQGDIGFCRQLLQAFSERVADQLTAVEQAAKAGDAVALARKAHAAKSVAGTLAADAIYRGAAELEHLGRQADLSAADPALQRFRREVARCLEYIPQLLATVAASKQGENSKPD
jgi:HPt (histidine-containing phosphotransfer) domain-containing protein